MNDIQNEIKKIAEELDCTFVYADWYRANIIIDKIAHENQLPILLSIVPVSGQYVFKNGVRYVSDNVLIFFLDKVELDTTDEDHDTIERMKDSIKQFISKVEGSDIIRFKDLTNLRYSVVYDKLDANLGGVSIETEIELKKGECYGL